MGVRMRFDLGRASQDPRTTDIDIALVSEVVGLESSEHGDAVIVGVVVVPLKALGVDEEHQVRETVVIVDYISDKG